jgi:hypothetical protein
MKDSKGWDGKLRVEPRATITNPEALEDPEYSDSDAPPVEEINADEGGLSTEAPRLEKTSQKQTGDLVLIGLFERCRSTRE